MFNKKVGTLFGIKGLINAGYTDHLKLTKSLQAPPKPQIDLLMHITNPTFHIRDSIRYIVGGLNLQLVYSKFNINIHSLHSSINQSTNRLIDHTHGHIHTFSLLYSHPIPLFLSFASLIPLPLLLSLSITHARTLSPTCSYFKSTCNFTRLYWR